MSCLCNANLHALLKIRRIRRIFARFCLFGLSGTHMYPCTVHTLMMKPLQMAAAHGSGYTCKSKHSTCTCITIRDEHREIQPPDPWSKKLSRDNVYLRQSQAVENEALSCPKCFTYKTSRPRWPKFVFGSTFVFRQEEVRTEKFLKTKLRLF